MLVKRTIKESVQEYEYKGKEKVYNDYIQIRIENEKKEKLKEIAKFKGYPNYSKFIKSIIDSAIADFKKSNK